MCNKAGNVAQAAGKVEIPQAKNKVKEQPVAEKSPLQLSNLTPTNSNTAQATGKVNEGGLDLNAIVQWILSQV
jgi:hypothetical protein